MLTNFTPPYSLAPRHRSTGRLSDAAALPASPLDRPQMHRTRRNYDGPPKMHEEELTRRIRAALQRQPPLPEHVLEAVIDILRRGDDAYDDWRPSTASSDASSVLRAPRHRRDPPSPRRRRDPPSPRAADEARHQPTTSSMVKREMAAVKPENLSLPAHHHYPVRDPQAMAARQAARERGWRSATMDREEKTKKLQDLMARKYPHADHADDGCTQIGGAKTKAKSMMHWPAKAGDGTQFSEIGARMTEVKLEQSKPPGPGDFRHGAPSYPAYARRGVGPNSA